jgi:6-phosphogluconolactonase
MDSVCMHVLDGCEVFVSTIVRNVRDLIQAAIDEHDSCHMVFPGGRSPRPVFERLGQEDLPWSKLHLYPSDERCVPVGSEERNDKLIDELLIIPGILPEENLHRIPAEFGAHKGAQLYCEMLRDIPCFDLALLGLGPDGHTASLFPNDSWDEEKAALPVYRAPKYPPERVTISLACLRDARERWVIVAGSEKKLMMERIQQGEDFPVTRILPTLFFIDKEVMT